METLIELFKELTNASPVLSLLLVGVAIIIYAYNERAKASAVSNGSGGHPVTVLRKDMDGHVEKIHTRITEHREEFLEFKAEVARTLATKQDLRDTEVRIKEHITSTARVSRR